MRHFFLDKQLNQLTFMLLQQPLKPLQSRLDRTHRMTQLSPHPHLFHFGITHLEAIQPETARSQDILVKKLKQLGSESELPILEQQPVPTRCVVKLDHVASLCLIRRKNDVLGQGVRLIAHKLLNRLSQLDKGLQNLVVGNFLRASFAKEDASKAYAFRPELLSLRTRGLEFAVGTLLFLPHALDLSPHSLVVPSHSVVFRHQCIFLCRLSFFLG